MLGTPLSSTSYKLLITKGNMTEKVRKNKIPRLADMTVVLSSNIFLNHLQLARKDFAYDTNIDKRNSKQCFFFADAEFILASD